MRSALRFVTASNRVARRTLLAASVAAVLVSLLLAPQVHRATLAEIPTGPSPEIRSKLAELVFRAGQAARTPTAWPKSAHVRIVEGTPGATAASQPPASFWTLGALPREWPSP